MLKKLKFVARAAATHARNLAMFAALYKTARILLRGLHGQEHQAHAFLSACVGGYTVFGKNNPINMQINLYLLSRVMIALCRLVVERGLDGTSALPFGS